MTRISFIVTLLILTASVACTVNPAQYVEKGNKLFDSGKYSDAEINYQKAIQKDPNFGDAYYRLGLVQLRTLHPDAAFESFTRANQLLPNRTDAAVALADTSLGLYGQTSKANYYDLVVAISSRLVKENPKSFDGVRLKGYLAMFDKRYPEALDLLKLANAIKPMQPESLHVLVQCLIKDEQGAEAEKTALSLIHEVKSFGPVYDTLYGYYMSSNREADAERILKTKVANNPQELAYRLELAAHYARAKNDEGLAATLEDLKSSKIFPNAPMDVGNFLFRINRLDEAMREFQAGARNDPKQRTQYEDRTAAVLMAQGKPDQSLAIVEGIIKQHPDDFEARSMRAGINIDSGDPARLRDGMAELQSLVKEKPSDATTRFNLGKARLKSGDANGALTDFKEALKINPGLFQARLLAANTSLQTLDYAGAQQYADQILQLTGDNPMARLIRIESVAGLGNFDEATSETNRLDKQFPGAVEPKLELASLALAQKKFAEAESMFRALYLADNRKDSRALQGLLEVYYSQNRYDTAIQFLTQEMAKSNSPAEIKSLLADAALRGGKLDLAIQQYDQLSNAEPKSSLDHLKLGDAYLQKGDTTQAISQFQTAKSLAPKDALVSSMLALSFHNAGRNQEAEQAYRAALALDSGNPLVMNNLAYLLAEIGGNLDDALRLAQDAVHRQPGNLALSDTVGWIYLKKNLADSAIQVLSNVVQRSPANSLYRYHLGAALLQKGDKVGAKVQLDAALVNKPDKINQTKISQLIAKAQ